MQWCKTTYRSKVSGTLPWQNWLNCRLQWTAPRLRCKPIQSLKYIQKLMMRHFRTWYFVFSALNKYLLTVKQMTDSDAHNHKELNSDWTSPKIRSKITLGKSLLNIYTLCSKSRYCQFLFLKKMSNFIGQNCQINIDQNCQIYISQ